MADVDPTAAEDPGDLDFVEEPGDFEPGSRKPKGEKKGKPRGRPFTGVTDPRNRTGAGQPLPPVKIEYLPGVPPQLCEMRYVCDNAFRQNEKVALRALRSWLKKDPAGFMKTKSRLETLAVEKEAKGSGDGEGSPAEPVEEVGTDAAVKLCERILKDLRT